MTVVGFDLIPPGPSAIVIPNAASTGLAITGAAAQTGDYISVENSAGVDQFEVDSTGVAAANGFKTTAITSGALPTVVPVSGVAFQALTTRDVTLVIAVTATLLSGTATIALSPDNVTASVR